MNDPSGGGPLVDLGVKLEAWLDVGRSIRDGVDRLNKQWQAKPEALITREVFQGISAASGDLIFDLGGPARGRRRLVRRISVGGSLVTSTPAGTAYILQEASQPPIIGPMMSFVDLTGNALPQKAFYGRGELAVDAPDHLWCLIHNPTATTQYVAVLWYEEYELGFGIVAP